MIKISIKGLTIIALFIAVAFSIDDRKIFYLFND